MDRGDLVPDSLMIDLVMEEATFHLEEGRSLLLDGFPRNLEQAQALEEVAAPFRFCFVFVACVTQFSFALLSLFCCDHFRWIHPASGRIYSYSYKPPQVEGKDDVTGEPLVQRDDDKPESVRKRLDAYDEVCVID
jgi:adenylate kinase family enzyme